MNKHFLILCLVVVNFISITNSASIKTLNKECLCDITDQCDTECCCDTSCDSTLIKHWGTFKLYLDDSFGIPFCSKLSDTDVSVLDLHSGLRTIYSVIKRLFCISSVNLVDPADWYKKKILDSDLSIQSATINSVQTASVQNKYIQSLTQFSIAGLPLKGSNGLCRSSSQLTKNNQKSSSCRVYLPSTATIATSLLSVGQIQTSLGTTLKKYDTLMVSTGTITSQTLTTSCAGVSCFNVVRQLRIFINKDTGAIDANSYAVLGPITIDRAGYINVDYQYTFVSTSSSGQITLPYSSKSGYTFGSRLNLLYKDSASQYYRILNPLNLAIRKTDGTCRTAISDESANSFIDIKFGTNQIISCFGTANLIYQNLIQAFNYVGKYGVSSTKLSEYINVTLPSTAGLSSESVQLLIYYLKIGTPENVQYQIQKVVVDSVTSKDGLSTLYVQFVSVENSYKLVVPPAPVVDAYLPNDFLYPFFVA